MKRDLIPVHLWPGVPMALASAILFGATAPLAKVLLGLVEPQLLAGILYLGAGGGLAVLQLLQRIAGATPRETPLRRADLPWLALVIITGGILGPSLLMLGLKLTDASSGSLLLNLEGLATMGMAWLFFHENVDRRLLVGAFAILAGAIVISWQGQGLSINTGAALIAAACLAWGVDNNLTRKLSASDPVQIAMIKGLAAGVVNLAIALARGAHWPEVTTFGAAALLGFFGVGVSLVLFVLALRHLGTARTGAYFSLAPFIGAVVAVALLDEPVTLQLVMAGALMAFGLWLHLAERHAHDHRHSALTHEHAHIHDDHHDHIHPEEVAGAHSHVHQHQPSRHVHAHYPDLHHRHGHQHD